MVTVYPLAVAEELKKWPERSKRKRTWFSLEDAAQAVEEADLGDVIARFVVTATEGHDERNAGVIGFAAERASRTHFRTLAGSFWLSIFARSFM
jgi:hypothetical protein